MLKIYISSFCISPVDKSSGRSLLVQSNVNWASDISSWYLGLLSCSAVFSIYYRVQKCVHPDGSQ